MRVIAKSTLVKFWKQPGHEDAQSPLESWHDAVLKTRWRTPQDVKAQFGQASVCGNNRVVFNIGGNKYRLIAFLHAGHQLAYIKQVLTHAEYDQGNWKP